MRRALALAGMEHLSVAVLRALSERGIAAAVAGCGDGAMVRSSRRCRRFYSVAPGSAELAAAGDDVVEAAARAAEDFGADVVVPVDVSGALLASRLRARLPGPAFYPTPAPETLLRLDDKWRFHELLGELGLPRPRAWLAADSAELAAVPVPVVCKPRTGFGGIGVRVARDKEGLAGVAAFPVVAQEYVPGEDVDVSFLAQEGRLVAWAVQVRRGGTIHFIDDEGVVDFARRLAGMTRYTGLAHVDMRYRAGSCGEALPIECNPRFWGTFLHTIGLGVDFLGAGLQIAEGGAPAPLAAAPVGSCPGARDALRALAGGRGLDAGAWAHLRQKVSDPGPELRKMYLRLAGRGGEIGP